MHVKNLKVGDTIQFNTGNFCPPRIAIINGIDYPYFDCADFQGHYKIHKDLIEKKVIKVNYITENIEKE
jgi:hypothetical protein